MATADQLKALLKSHADRDDQRFYSIALQMAAREARQGHNKLAKEIKLIICFVGGALDLTGSLTIAAKSLQLRNTIQPFVKLFSIIKMITIHYSSG